MTDVPELVAEFWLLTAGTRPLVSPPRSTVVGTAMAALVHLEKEREVRWVGDHETLALDTVADCRCAGRTRRWHTALREASREGPVPARFTLDPLVSRVWRDTAESLASTGSVTMTRRPLRAPRFEVADPDRIRTGRARLLRLLPRGADVQDLRPRERALLTVAVASDSETELFGVHGLELGADTYEALTRAVQGDPALARLEAAAAYTATPLDRWVP